MASHDYKKPGLLRAGFQYQDLVAIEVLITYYRERDQYDWVQLDAEDSRFRSIEDVVARRPDGLYELTQVKFTADPEAPVNSLSWRWLTEVRSKGGTSLLQKWAATTLHHKTAGTLAQAILKTDRRPDLEFDECLNDTTVDYERLSATVRTTVDNQIGSSEASKLFFDAFSFVHSQPVLDDLEEELWSKVASDTDRGGWAIFREQVQRWSTRKGQPEPDGKIKYIHLRQAFAVERSKPMPQSFVVPPTYSLPDDDFDKGFLERVTGADGVTVLWGPPGCGKSTYLSHCVERIDRNSAVCIRHHYFLSLEDRSEGRFHYHAIARSLKRQLEEAIPDLATSRGDGLRTTLESAALHLQGESRRLVVVIDGLDHVWRDHRDHQDMQALFDSLLPLPTNVRLVVGTQKIASDHLPTALLRALPIGMWTKLPLMSGRAVYRWLCSQDAAGRLNLTVIDTRERKQVVRQVARAFHDISQGLPLHLVYSFEAVVRSGGPVTPNEIAELPSCPTGDIRHYYRSFWDRISEKARAILHVLAGLEFGPPPFALPDCFGHSDGSLSALAEIGHLLDYREMGVRAFHGSLFVFVRDLAGHKATFRMHAVDVLTWLETRAPAYWRWSWLWIMQGQLGNPSDLLTRPSRRWVIRSLASGFPVEQVIAILDHAERAAFDGFDLRRVLRFHSLKTRASNGPEFQTSQWALFIEVATTLSADSYVRAHLRADLGRASEEILPFIARSTNESSRLAVARDAVGDLQRRIARRSGHGMPGSYHVAGVAQALVAVVATTGVENAQRVIAWAESAPEAEGEALIACYVRASLLASEFANVFFVGKLLSSADVDRDVLAALCLEGLTPAAKPSLVGRSHPAIRCLALAYGEVPERSWVENDLAGLFNRTDGDAMMASEMARVLYDTFFSALAAALSGGEPNGRSRIPDDVKSLWLAQAVRALERLATNFAREWNVSRKWPTLGFIYDSFECPSPTSYYEKVRRHIIAVRLALRDIAIDLCTIAVGLRASALVEAHDISLASASPYWMDELWVEAFSERRLPLHRSEAAQQVVDRTSRYYDSRITEFQDRTNAIVQLALFACDNGLDKAAKRELERAVGCLLGYGWRKDMFAFEVLESLQMLARNGDADAKGRILDLAGEFGTITDYTDGAETSYARQQYYEAMPEHFPERVPGCYAHLIREEEWGCAEALSDAFAQSDYVESGAGRALLETLIAPTERRALERSGLSARHHTRMAVQSIRRKVGGVERGSATETIPSGPTPAANSTASESGKVADPDPRDFPPGRLQDFSVKISSVEPYDSRRVQLVGWLKHWEAAGRIDDALADFGDLTSAQGGHYGLDDALDVAFEMALRYQGRSRAFDWIVRAHIRGSGWHRWYGGDKKARDRMRAVAHHYCGQWREFIEKTSRPESPVRRDGDGIELGLSRLVFFLVEVGQCGLARDFTFEMVRIFEGELAEQPIEAPEWSK